MSYLINKDDKWKAVSHLQKCIRRGRSDLVEDIARQLWALDNAYLRHRLNVIFSEDLGIANPELANELQQDKLNKRWVDAQGGIDYLVSKLKDMCNSVKDRTACEFGSIANYKVFEHETGIIWEDLTVEEAIDYAWNELLSVEARAAAVFKAVGTDIFEHSHLPEGVKGDWDKWIDSQRAHGVPENIVTMMQNGKRTQREWHPAFLGLCWENKQKHPEVIVEKTPVSQGMCGPYVSEAIDGHTMEGKKALSLLWSKHPLLKDSWLGMGYQQDYETTMIALKKIVFLFEGGVTNKSLDYPLAREISTAQKNRWKNLVGIDPQKAAQTVWNAMPFLHNTRNSLIHATLQADTPSP